MRFELTTPTLARLCSTPELRPLKRNLVSSKPLYGPSVHELQPESTGCAVGMINASAHLLKYQPTGHIACPEHGTTDMPLTPDELLQMLKSLGMETQTYHHEAVFTVEESEKIKQDIPGGHTKNLFLKDKKGNYFLIVAEGTAQIRLNSVHGLISARGRVSFGNSDDLMALLGVKPGSVTAFAPVNDQEGKVTVIVDEPLLRYDLINCHPLTNEMTTTISREDLLRFLDHVNHAPQIVQVSQTPENNDE